MNKKIIVFTTLATALAGVGIGAALKSRKRHCSMEEKKQKGKKADAYEMWKDFTGLPTDEMTAQEKLHSDMLKEELILCWRDCIENTDGYQNSEENMKVAFGIIADYIERNQLVSLGERDLFIASVDKEIKEAAPLAPIMLTKQYNTVIELLLKHRWLREVSIQEIDDFCNGRNLKPEYHLPLKGERILALCFPSISTITNNKRFCFLDED